MTTQDKNVLNLVREQEILSGSKNGGKGLLNIIDSGVKQLSTFIIDSQRKKESIGKIDEAFEKNVKKLENIYKNTENPLLRKEIIKSIENLKGIYSNHVAQVEAIYSLNESIENKIELYKAIEKNAIEKMDNTVLELKTVINNLLKI